MSINTSTLKRIEDHPTFSKREEVSIILKQVRNELVFGAKNHDNSIHSSRDLSHSTLQLTYIQANSKICHTPSCAMECSRFAKGVCRHILHTQHPLQIYSV